MFIDSIVRFFEQLWSTLKFLGFFILVIISWILISIFGDPNYMGGNANALNGRAQGDWWWVETYEECLEAIDQLEAKGSTFDTSALFKYEGDEFDVKYCFELKKNDYLKYGRDNPFKFKNENVKVYTFLFHKDTTIDDFAYSAIHHFCSYYFKLSPEYIENGKYREINAEELEAEFVSLADSGTPDHIEYFYSSLNYIDKETGELVFRLIGYQEENMPALSDEAVNAILDSIVIIK